MPPKQRTNGKLQPEHKAPAGGLYLSQRALEGLKSYAYKPSGYTVLDDLHQPVWNCELLPPVPAAAAAACRRTHLAARHLLINCSGRTPRVLPLLGCKLRCFSTSTQPCAAAHPPPPPTHLHRHRMHPRLALPQTSPTTGCRCGWRPTSSP